MTGQAEFSALLPAGMFDVLAPAAEQEAWIVDALMAVFAAHGYDRVDPPLMEFESTLCTTPESDVSAQTFRLMDPVSQRMMGLRSDMTMQMARIATTRLADAPRPLRLSSAGQVLRVRGTQMRPERQFTQVGVELIGSTAVAADVEAVVVAARALAATGAQGLSVDLNSPSIVAAVLDTIALTADARRGVRETLDHKDGARISALVADGSARRTLQRLVDAAGPADAAFERLKDIALPASAAEEITRLAAVAADVGAAAPELTLTIDPAEYRGFEYQTGVSFAVFARGSRSELGRGGRYAINGDETATGVSLYLEPVLRIASPPPPRDRIFVPHGAPLAIAARLRGDGWICVAGLKSTHDDTAEARRLGCSHLLADGEPRVL